MVTENQILKQEELKQLGKFYENNFRLIVTQDEHYVKIEPPPTPWFQLIFMTTSIGSFFIGIITFVYLKSDGYFQTHIGTSVFVFLLAVVTTFGTLALCLRRIYELKRISPLLEYDKILKTISIHNRKFTASEENVFCVLAYSPFDKYEFYAELQVILEINGVKTYHLIDTNLSSAKKTYKNIITEFGNLTGIQTIIAEPSNFFKNSKIEISIITPDKRLNK